MAAELESHWRGEENGLFRVMQDQELFAEHIRPLVQEHGELAALLSSVDLANPADQERIREAVDELHEHIAKEEDGLFPASLVELGGAEWDAAIAAWQEAHPGQELITD
jgi:hemerythrin-like domain-containing protein